MNGKKGERSEGIAKRIERRSSLYRPIIGMAVISILICGLFFPLLITGVAQALLPFQANGDLVQLDGRNIGSYLIDNNFTSPVFFHARPSNDSASTVDPDITLPDAYSQVPRINAATGIASGTLDQIINQNIEGVYWVFGSPFVNVLRLNLVLIKEFPSVYKNFTSSPSTG